MEETLRHVKYLARKLYGCDVQYVTVMLLRELNIPPNQDGYLFVKTAIVIYHKYPERIIERGLYAAVAEEFKCHLTEKQIESSIRHSIKTAWKQRDEKAWLRYIPAELGRPSNTDFISRLAQALELWEGCCLAYERKRKDAGVDRKPVPSGISPNGGVCEQETK